MQFGIYSTCDWFAKWIVITCKCQTNKRLIKCLDDVLTSQAPGRIWSSSSQTSAFLNAPLSPRVPVAWTSFLFLCSFTLHSSLSFSDVLLSYSFTLVYLYLCLYFPLFFSLSLSFFLSRHLSLSVSFFLLYELSWPHNFTLAQYSTNLYPCVA